MSFVIPLYNCLRLTQAMLASLVASLPRDLAHEIILVDDGSTDGTRDWLATLGPVYTVVLNEQNLGYAAANNRGAAVARGEFLALLNNDLVLSPGWLEPMLALHERLGARAGLIGNVQRSVSKGAIDHTGIAVNFKGKPEHIRARPWWSVFPGSWWKTPAVTGACVLIAAKLWRELGGFDQAFVNGCEDVDLCFRALAAGRTNAVSLRSVVQHHVSASPQRKLRDEQNTFKLVQRWRKCLVSLGARAWCDHYLQTHGATSHDPIEYPAAQRIFCYAYGLTRSPPPDARAGIDRLIDVEMTRWLEILGTVETDALPGI